MIPSYQLKGTPKQRASIFTRRSFSKTQFGNTLVWAYYVYHKPKTLENSHKPTTIPYDDNRVITFCMDAGNFSCFSLLIAKKDIHSVCVISSKRLMITPKKEVPLSQSTWLHYRAKPTIQGHQMWVFPRAADAVLSDTY